MTPVALRMTFDHPKLCTAAISLSGALHQPMVKDDPRLHWDLAGLYKGAFGTPFDMARFNKANPSFRKCVCNHHWT